jgi:hypothetical protein
MGMEQSPTESLAQQLPTDDETRLSAAVDLVAGHFREIGAMAPTFSKEAKHGQEATNDAETLSTRFFERFRNMDVRRALEYIGHVTQRESFDIRLTGSCATALYSPFSPKIPPTDIDLQICFDTEEEYSTFKDWFNRKNDTKSLDFPMNADTWILPNDIHKLPQSEDEAYHIELEAPITNDRSEVTPVDIHFENPNKPGIIAFLKQHEPVTLKHSGLRVASRQALVDLYIYRLVHELENPEQRQKRLRTFADRFPTEFNAMRNNIESLQDRLATFLAEHKNASGHLITLHQSLDPILEQLPIIQPHIKPARRTPLREPGEERKSA